MDFTPRWKDSTRVDSFAIMGRALGYLSKLFSRRNNCMLGVILTCGDRGLDRGTKQSLSSSMPSLPSQPDRYPTHSSSLCHHVKGSSKALSSPSGIWFAHHFKLCRISLERSGLRATTSTLAFGAFFATRLTRNTFCGAGNPRSSRSLACC